MKTAIAVPDEVFWAAERLARSSGRSRSELYSAAVREYIVRNAPDLIAADMDALVTESVRVRIDPFVNEASRRILEATEW
ncbi:MAG: hypothetical protein KF809_04775 [Chloroflexi bacterium]|nr:hypothetical protein [Chloroflexota bacterium]